MRPINDSLFSHFAFMRFSSSRNPFYVNRGTYEAGYQSGMHFHDFPQLWYCIQGKYIHYIDGQEYVCEKGSMATVPGGIPHDMKIIEADTEYCCWVLTVRRH